MAGFYVHIPFCRKACRYCDFHFGVSLNMIPEMLQAMKKEISDKMHKYRDIEFESLYFGGGTPSVLSINQLIELREFITDTFHFVNNYEFTLESNPDDLNEEYTAGLREIGVNRLSIGIQSFLDKDLELMRRSHTSEQAVRAVKNARETGISNISVDLIYGIPGTDLKEWEENIHHVIDLDVPHLSAYHLTYEKGTVFSHWVKKGRLNPVSEELSIAQFKTLRELIHRNGFIHYEISNFCKKGFESRHNQIYWTRKKYIGIGPSAHSFDGSCRYWNISNNKKYIERIFSGSDYYEAEELGERDKYNEYILTGLRTIEGIQLLFIKEEYGEEYYSYAKRKAEYYNREGILEKDSCRYYLNEKGILLSDQIMRDFFKI